MKGIGLIFHQFLRYNHMRIGVLIFIFSLSNLTLGQTGKTVIFHVDNISVRYKVLSDSTYYLRYKEKAITQFKLQGYVGLFLKDSTQKSNTLHYYFGYRQHFEKIILVQQSHESDKKPISRSQKNYSELLKTLNRELLTLENKGYPFASIQFTDQKEEHNKLELTYEIDSGDFFKINQITIKSKSKFNEQTILNLIDVHAGEPYNEAKILRIDQLLKESGLYKLMRPAEILFTPGKADVYLYLEKTNASEADGFVGFQQDQNSNKLVLNGFINLSLHNSFHRAEKLEVNWKNNPNNSQNLKVNFEFPFILQTPIGVGARVNLQKQDSSFVRADSYFDLSYQHSFYKFGIFYQIENSNSLLNTVNPVFRDYRKNTAGLSLQLKPVFAGNFKFFHPAIYTNGGFFRYRADSLSESINTNANTKYLIRYEQVVDFLKYFHLNHAIQFEGLTSNQNLSRNELIYFGGLKSIRGFYELELSGNDVLILNNELEFRPVESVGFKILYDYAQFHYQNFNRAHAIGAGFAFLAGNIKLEIILANGWLNSNSLEFSNSKIHLGFKSTF